MKKKPRYRRRPIGEEEGRAARPAEPPSQEKPTPEESACAEKTEEKQGAPPSGKQETILGFGLLGATVGFLTGYGEMNPFNGIAQGIVGLLVGVVMGYLPFMSIKR
jgi:hypothetical protein